jgi:hypothetical protein
MEVEYSSEMSANICQTTQHFISKERTLHNHHCKNSKSDTGEDAVNEYHIDGLSPSLL